MLLFVKMEGTKYLFGIFCEGVVCQKCVCQIWVETTLVYLKWSEFFSRRMSLTSDHKNEAIVGDFEMLDIVNETISFANIVFEKSNWPFLGWGVRNDKLEKVTCIASRSCVECRDLHVRDLRCLMMLQELTLSLLSHCHRKWTRVAWLRWFFWETTCYHFIHRYTCLLKRFFVFVPVALAPQSWGPRW